MIAKKIKKTMEEESYEYFGLRMDDQKYEIGSFCEASHQWMQDNPEDGSPYNQEMGCWDCGELPGTCAIKINSDSNINTLIEYVKKTYCYAKNLYLIAGDAVEYGYDPDEVVIKDAVVLYKI